MTELTPQQRIAALKARRAPASPNDAQEDSVVAADVAPASAAKEKHSQPRAMPMPKAPSPTRLAATGVSLVSFGAMVVAMGPLTADAQVETVEAPIDEQVAATATPPTQPNVVIEVIPNYVETTPTSELNSIEAAKLAAGTEQTPLPSAETSAPAPTASATAAAPVAAPVAAAPVVAAPAPTAAPAAAPTPTAAPAPTAPAATAPPATAAPITVAPTTAAPAPTAPPATPPPRSTASG